MSVAVLGVLAALVGALGTYLVAARRLSGKITTSAASELWEESRAIRQDLESRNRFLVESLDRCRGRLDELELRLDQQDQKNRDLRLENIELREKVARLEAA